MGKKSNALLQGAGNLSNGTLGGNNLGYGPIGSGIQSNNRNGGMNAYN